ncbi:MAG: DUF4399 domain-containing protein [Vicingaceae bacterium]
MKKLRYIFLSISTIILFSCAGGDHDETADESVDDSAESHEGHDHAAMEEGVGGMEPVSPPENARVFFANLEDGQVISSPFIVHFGTEGINVHPAGELIEGTGHHHIIIDEGPTPLGTVVPADESHIHFGGGQLETELKLTPGEHSLTLQFADGMHRSYGESLSSTITVKVEAAE